MFSPIDIRHRRHPSVGRTPRTSGPVELVRRDVHQAHDVTVVSVVQGYDDIVASVSSAGGEKC